VLDEQGLAQSCQNPPRAVKHASHK